MTMTVPVLPPPRLSAVPCCPNCGTDLSLTFPGNKTLPSTPPISSPTEDLAAAQAQIDDMHAQIRLLNTKATAAVDRWADYEDELASLRAELNTAKQRERETAAAKRSSGTTMTTTTTPQTPTITASPTSPRTTGSPGMGFAAAATNRISALLSRKSTPNLKALPGVPNHNQHSSYGGASLLPTPPVSGGHHTSYSTSALPGTFPTPRSPLSGGRGGSFIDTPPLSSTEDLLDALTREQQLRLAAEAKMNDTSREVEELSVTLFEEANEMVATERREKAQLKERVNELERRDREKKVRLERLEGAVGRIERVRSMLEAKTEVVGETDREAAAE